MPIRPARTRSIFHRYNIVADNDLHDAMQKLAAFHDSQKTATTGHLRYTQRPNGVETPEKQALS